MTSPHSDAPRRVVILGSTGSVGEKALEVAARFPDRLQVVALAARCRGERLLEQAKRFRPEIVALVDEEAAARFPRADLPAGTRFLAGPDSLPTLAALPGAHVVVNAVVGSAGLLPSLAALKAGRRLALANKESIVLAGDLLTRAARASGEEILPIDSEHSGLFQCLEGRRATGVNRLILTASGGPFRRFSRAEMERVTPEQALNHPVWSMGPRITVDSATLLNKGFEIIEARWLFGVPVERIEVLIHPQSVVHALVEMEDGSLLAQLSAPDMVLPVQYALSYPERWSPPLPPCDLTRTPLEFELPDTERFPCLALARAAAEHGGAAPAALNAADEVAVAAFLERRLRFSDIPAVLESALDGAGDADAGSVEAVLEADRAARERARSAVAAREGR